LNFAYYGKKKKDEKVQAMADRIKARLSPEDQDWVDQQLATEPPFPPPFRYSGIGLRLGADVQFAALADFNDYAKTLKGMGVSAASPAVALGAEISPFVQVIDGLEAGFSLGGIFLGGFSASTNSASPQQNGNIDYDLWDGGLDLKATFLRADRGKIRFFLEADPRAYLGSLSVVNSDTSVNWGFLPVNGNFSTTGFGGVLKLGMEWKPLPNSLVGFFAGYQMADLTGFTGSGAANGSSTAVPGKLVTVRDPSGTRLEFVPDGSPDPAGASPTALDLGGVVAGAQLTALF
ncbi:MAG TPA: hypothetical protein VFR02_09490, partial [bacterium]|nr:hypothetical protein [bacterium]